MKLFCLFICSLILSHQTLACKGVAPKEMNIAIDLNNQSRFFYDGKKVYKDKPQVSLQNCQSTAAQGKYIMVALGIENNVLSNQIGAYSFNDELSTFGDSCSLINNPLDYQEPTERHEKLFEKREFFNKCLTVQITDFASGPIAYPEEQPGCEVTRVSEKSINMKGAFCFVQPRQDSSFSIHVEVDNACKTKEFLKKHNLTLQDINAVVNTYKAGDASGRSADLTAVTTTNVRLSVNPLKEILEVSDNYGVNRPVWPSEWSGGQVDFANLSIAGRSDLNDTISTSLVVDNRCKRKCVNGLCSSKCDYAQPVIAQYELYEQHNGKFEYLKTWYDGGVASAQWQGMLFGIGHDFSKGVLTVGKKYRLEVIIDEPDFSFHQFDGRFSERIRLRNNHIHDINRNGGYINEIPLIDTIHNGELVPVLAEISGIHFDSQGLGMLLQTGVRSFQAYLNNSFWPPFYSKVCNPITGQCRKLGDAKVQMTIEFELGPMDMDEGKYELINPMISKKSNIGPSYSAQPLLPKKVRCRRSRRRR